LGTIGPGLAHRLCKVIAGTLVPISSIGISAVYIQ